MNQKTSRNTVECQLLYKLGEHYCIIVQLSLFAPNFITVTLVSLQILHWLVYTEVKGAFWMLHIFKFPCAVWLGILFGLLHVSLQKRIDLPHREQIHGSGLLACRACMLFPLPLSYVCLYFKKKEEERPPLEKSPLSYWELYHCKLKSHLIKLHFFLLQFS